MSSSITEEMISADVPGSEREGELFEAFLKRTPMMLGPENFKDVDFETLMFRIKNRMRRAYEAGYSHGRYGEPPL